MFSLPHPFAFHLDCHKILKKDLYTTYALKQLVAGNVPRSLLEIQWPY